MKESIELVEARIKYLEELAGTIPEKSAFTVLARLDEAREILRILKARKSI
jgi:hypothetical protein